jgi:hypothetical protein
MFEAFFCRALGIRVGVSIKDFYQHPLALYETFEVGLDMSNTTNEEVRDICTYLTKKSSDEVSPHIL